MYEVFIEASEPWSVGQRNAVRDAILTFCECNTASVAEAYTAGFGLDDADAQLAAFCGPDYAGFGANAHDAADGFVFESQDVAERFADVLRDAVRHIGMTVRMWTLETA